ncbi:MAG: helix-turn-helix domain-containing protein [Defluviitaleaceae bacterium]|nr:helix-turn-helix domain-containing protein [Defluviitaleaceae bacterium]
MNMQAIGKRISALRKERDMTQVDLADRLGVTYQAVSSWERGNSMPDIAKLPDISQILNVSIDELLGDEKTAVIVKNVLTGQSATDVDLRALAGASPILKPSQMSQAVKGAKGIKIDADILGEIAPHMNSEDLKEILLGCESVDSYMIDEVAPHMNSEDLRDIFMHFRNIDIHILEEIAPHMNSEDLRDILMGCENVDSDMIAEVAPHMNSEDLKEVLLSLSKR